MQSPNHGEAEQFLQAVFGDKPEGLHVLIWTLPGKTSAWFTSLEEAARYGTREVEGEVYMGVGLSPQDFGAHARCKAEEVAAIGGLWADVDVADETRKKPNLPRNESEALELLGELPVKPTALVHSGGGFQAWWLFKELWVFEDQVERERAAQLARRFNETLRNTARRRGADVDSTCDLARVLRLPGTVNHKIPGKPRPVRIVELELERRYEPSEFETFLADLPLEDSASANKETPRTKVRLDEVGRAAISLKVSATANPPIEKLEALLANDDKAKRTWEKRRKDIEGSPSSYDMAWACVCVLAFWTDQEIVDGLVARRRKHGDALKLDRPDYYARTVLNARRSVNVEKDKAEAHGAIERAIETKDTYGIMDEVNTLLETDIRRIVKVLSEPPEYVIELKSGKAANFGTAKNILNYSLFQERYFDLAETILPEGLKRYQWLNVVKAMTALLAQSENRVELGSDATETGALLEWIEVYLRNKSISEVLDDAVIDKNQPWKDKEGSIYIRNDDLRLYIERKFGIRFGVRQLPKALKARGLEPVTKKLSGNTTRTYWKLTPEVRFSDGDTKPLLNQSSSRKEES